MQLEELGYDHDFYDRYMEAFPEGFEPGRVLSEQKERYIIGTAAGEFDAEITGSLRFTAQTREDFPAVGDWVAVVVYDDSFAIIQGVLPRTSVIKRKSVGRVGEVQVIAANIDFAFIVQAADRDFNLNRLERYLTICYDSGVRPLIVLTKIDLAEEEHITEMTRLIRQRLEHVPLFPVSNETQKGFDMLKDTLEKGRTYCLLGSSGAGKSTLLNNLLGKTVMKTGAISESSDRGRHVTTSRELVVLENGAIIIDNPGMREVGIAGASGGLEVVFKNIALLAQECRFTDCTHTGEKGCAVAEALEKGQLDAGAYENYLKMEREKQRFESSVAERRKKEKHFGKLLKDYHKKNLKNRNT